MRRLETVRTPHQRIIVWGDEAERDFRVAGASQAWWHRDRRVSGLAWDNMAAAALLRAAGPPATLLMLGLAGGTTLRLLRHLLPDLRITAVEIDPGVVELARRHMELDALQLEVHLAEAYGWLAESDRRWDVVIDDLYAAREEDVERPEWPPSAGGLLRRAVADDGVLAVNLVTGRGHRRVQSRFRRWMAAEFPCCLSVRTPAGANECLAGGGSLLGARSLQRWSGAFSHPEDRRLWDQLRVRPLGSSRRGGAGSTASGRPAHPAGSSVTVPTQ